ncbi:hypothetical protein JOM56_005759 [Amanita muscaria]
MSKLKLGPSKLSQILVNLNARPRLTLDSVKSLKVAYAFQNDHFGARHFVKEQLPRVRYANPALDIQIEKLRKSPQENWRPELKVEFINGPVEIIDMHGKWSTTILKELMDMAGGDLWAQWKSQARASDQPIIPGEVIQDSLKKKSATTGGLQGTPKAKQDSMAQQKGSTHTSPTPSTSTTTQTIAA